MHVSMSLGQANRLECRLTEGERTVVLYASDADAAIDQVLVALDEASRTGHGECVWATELGDYRLAFRRQDDRVLVVALRSTGTLTGWQHLLRAETPFQPFAEQVRSAMAALGRPR